MKNIYVTNVNGFYEYIVVKGKHKPNGIVVGKLAYDPITGALEDPRWIQLEQIADPETGVLVPTFTANQALKTQIIADDLAKKEAQDTADVAEETKRDLLLDRLEAIDVNVINDIATIRAAIQDLKDLFLYNFDSAIKAKKDKKVK